MVPKRSLLEQMEQNPAQDWKIKDIETLCDQVGLVLKPPSSGSHYKVFSDMLHGALTVPHKRPIKPYYIRQIVDMAQAHIRVREDRMKGG